MSEATQLRVDVLELRLRLEASADAAKNRACPSREIPGVDAQLLFLLSDVEPGDPWSEMQGLVQRARAVYRRSSDVLHGRVSMLNLPGVVVEEWRAVVDEVEQVDTRVTSG